MSKKMKKIGKNIMDTINSASFFAFLIEIIIYIFLFSFFFFLF